MWDDPTLVFGVLPAGLAYHVFYSIAAAAVWALAVRYAWPSEVEDSPKPRTSPTRLHRHDAARHHDGLPRVAAGPGLVRGRRFRGTAGDYFLADRSIGPFMLLLSIFGTTMTAFALVGSTGESFRIGIGVYGMMASWSGLVHVGVFFFVGIRLWAIGKRYGFVTQVQYFRDRFESNALGWLLFPILVALVIPYLMIGLLGRGAVVTALTEGAFPRPLPRPAAACPLGWAS